MFFINYTRHKFCSVSMPPATVWSSHKIPRLFLPELLTLVMQFLPLLTNNSTQLHHIITDLAISGQATIPLENDFLRGQTLPLPRPWADNNDDRFCVQISHYNARGTNITIINFFSGVVAVVIIVLLFGLLANSCSHSLYVVVCPSVVCL